VLALERSARSFRDLIDVARVRDNVDPLLDDAHATDRLVPLLPGGADIVYQDIAQRDQAAIFVRACRRFLRPEGLGVLMVKARSVDLARSPAAVYDEVEAAIRAAGFRVVERRDLGPWEKDHAALLVRAAGDA
jgi:fibrillarin-like pre-rRNA processing protein